MQHDTSPITWTLAAWEDYQYWQGQDRKTLTRINAIIRDCLREPFAGIGKPESLKENLAGFWSRRIDDTHRLVYCVDGGDLVIIACRYCYENQAKSTQIRQEHEFGIQAA